MWGYCVGILCKDIVWRYCVILLCKDIVWGYCVGILCGDIVWGYAYDLRDEFIFVVMTTYINTFMLNFETSIYPPGHGITVN